MTEDALFWDVVRRDDDNDVALRGVTVNEAEALRSKWPKMFKLRPSPDQQNPWELPT